MNVVSQPWVIETLLFFGSFDPITLGHEAVIQAGLDIVKPKSIQLIPAYKEGWGKKLTSFVKRREMINLVIKNNPSWESKVSVNDVEEQNKLSGVTAETIHFLLGNQMQSQSFGFLMGADWLVSFPSWREWDWMLSIAPAFVALRGDETNNSVVKKVPQISKFVDQSIFFLPEEKVIDTRHISSTLVRNNINGGKETDLVSKEVLDYIHGHGLYQDK